MGIIPKVSALWLAGLAMRVFADSDVDAMSSLEGTWSSKSNQVFTGPGFYDPVDELLIEPALPGISYSFTKDGYFEEAVYQVQGNPRDPTCPKGALTFQHGTYEVLSNGSLVLTPFAVDGRQLYSDPCKDNGISTYSRYNQTELFKEFTVGIDDYHGIYKLQLYQFDGSPMTPMYLAYKPPMMLPTVTLNPTASAQATEGSQKSVRQLIKRSLENKHKTSAKRVSQGFLNYDLFWYLSAAMIGTGSVLFLLA